MSFTVLVPARLGSTRLPGKPLADIGGKPMVVQVALRARRSGARDVVVAADDAAIVEACERHGVPALLTAADHASGSDRLAEACALLGLDGDDTVVNVQGDEPMIDPQWIARCAETLVAHPECAVATVAHAIDDAAALQDPNVVKVVLDAGGRALYFSRAPLPWWRDAPRADAADGAAADDGVARVLCDPPPLRHVGLYAYRAGFLRRFPLLPPSPLERIEALEQLRVLWHGGRIAVWTADGAGAPGVDTPADLARVRALWPTADRPRGNPGRAAKPA